MTHRRFPRSDIVSLLDAGQRYNLAESTTRDLTLRDLVDLVGEDRLLDLPLSYGSAQGLPSLREAIGQHLNVSPAKVLTTQGTALGMAMLALELCAEGSEVLLFRPCFPPAKDMLLGVSAKVRELHLDFSTNFAVDLGKFADALSPATALVSIASPQNPTGIVTPPEVLRQMLEVMANRAPKARLFVDETYIDATYDDCRISSAASLDERVIVGSSLSKAHGTPGLRTGWLVLHDAELLERLITAKLNLVVSGSPLDETLAACVLENAGALMAPRRPFLATALRMVETWRSQHSHLVDWVRPQGGALCVMRLREDRFSDEEVRLFWDRLPDRELQLAPGTWFGLSAREFRLGFAFLSHEDLEQGLNALGYFLEETGPNLP